MVSGHRARARRVLRRRKLQQRAPRRGQAHAQVRRAEREPTASLRSTAYELNQP
ncbi:MAG: hypothetical protein ACLUNO_03930 [Oscillospiraceae bacterium]